MPLNREQQIVSDQVKSLLELIPVMQTLEKQVKESRTNLALQANTAFVARKCADLCDELKKKFRALEKQVATICFDQWINLKPPKVSTEFVTISDNSEPYIQYPTGPEKPGYFDFVAQLGPELIRPHYPAVLPEVGKYIGRGDQLPFGLKSVDILGVDYKLRVTKKRDL